MNKAIKIISIYVKFYYFIINHEMIDFNYFLKQKLFKLKMILK
jgi:hypothetical protein